MRARRCISSSGHWPALPSERSPGSLSGAAEFSCRAPGNFYPSHYRPHGLALKRHVLRKGTNPNSPRMEATPQVVECWHIRRYTADLASRIEVHNHSRTGCGNGLRCNHQLSTMNIPQLCCCTDSVTARKVDRWTGSIRDVQYSFTEIAVTRIRSLSEPGRTRDMPR